jgi:hypothetical protein
MVTLRNVDSCAIRSSCTALADRSPTGRADLSHSDPEHVFIQADNSHSAYAFQAWLRDAGVPTSALAVVRLAAQGPGGRA